MKLGWRNGHEPLLSLLWFILAVSITPAAAQVPSGTAKAGAANSWKIATYNINWGDVNLALVAATIREADADVVCLQETTMRSEPYLRQEFAKVYRHMRFFGHKGQYGAERCGILSRMPVSKATFLPPKHGAFGACIADLKIGGRQVQVINVHLEPMRLRAGGSVLDAWTAMGAMEKTHLAEIRYIWESRRKDVALVIAGDFNSPSQFQAPRLLRQNGLKDSLAEVHDNPDSLITWHWPFKLGDLSLRIDYIFHSSEFQTVQSQVLKSNASDHYLVISELRWAPQRPGQGDAESERSR